MNLFCMCTEQNPDFVGALLLAPRAPGMTRWDTWLCHDCFENHVCNDYPIAVCRATDLRSSGLFGYTHLFPENPEVEEE